MVSRTARRGIALIAAAVLSLSLAPAAVASGPVAPAAAKPHCASRLAAPAKKDGAARIARTRCFSTLAPALRFAAKGAAIPDDVTPDGITDALLLPNGKVAAGARTTIIGIHWEDADRGGRDRIYFVKGSSPCGSGRTWQIGKLDAGWDAIVSSAEAFGGCGTFTQFQKAKQAGTSRVCKPYCANLGPLNDRVISVRWSI